MRGCCLQCGREAEKFDRDFICEECRELRPRFDRVSSVADFEGVARETILAFKFRNHFWLRDDLVDWMEAMARARFKVAEIDVVVAMPMTFFRRLDRGYNQCDYLARALAKRLGRPYVVRAMKRVGSPRRQGELGEKDRRVNVIGTFAVRKAAALKGRTVLVVDDIMTTGSTLSECAAELKRAGVARVWGLTLARSLRT